MHPVFHTWLIFIHEEWLSNHSKYMARWYGFITIALYLAYLFTKGLSVCGILFCYLTFMHLSQIIWMKITSWHNYRLSMIHKSRVKLWGPSALSETIPLLSQICKSSKDFTGSSNSVGSLIINVNFIWESAPQIGDFNYSLKHLLSTGLVAKRTCWEKTRR